jgi:hypothetical protein
VLVNPNRCIIKRRNYKFAVACLQLNGLDKKGAPSGLALANAIYSFNDRPALVVHAYFVQLTRL